MWQQHWTICWVPLFQNKLENGLLAQNFWCFRVGMTVLGILLIIVATGTLANLVTIADTENLVTMASTGTLVTLVTIAAIVTVRLLIKFVTTETIRTLATLVAVVNKVSRGALRNLGNKGNHIKYRNFCNTGSHSSRSNFGKLGNYSNGRDTSNWKPRCPWLKMLPLEYWQLGNKVKISTTGTLVTLVFKVTINSTVAFLAQAAMNVSGLTLQCLLMFSVLKWTDRRSE